MKEEKKWDQKSEIGKAVLLGQSGYRVLCILVGAWSGKGWSFKQDKEKPCALFRQRVWHFYFTGSTENQTTGFKSMQLAAHTSNLNAVG